MFDAVAALLPMPGNAVPRSDEPESVVEIESPSTREVNGTSFSSAPRGFAIGGILLNLFRRVYALLTA
jgi:hypothetical protein